jgi:uncharacterized membrane protein (UPF0127 family)
MKQINNRTRKTILAQKYRLCTSIGSKAWGLMFSDEGKVKRHSLIFVFQRPMEQSLHMFFVFYPIDLLFLDEKKRIIDTKQNFRPFTTYYSSKMSKYVIELPQDTISKSKTKIGDKLEW